MKKLFLGLGAVAAVVTPVVAVVSCGSKATESTTPSFSTVTDEKSLETNVLEGFRALRANIEQAPVGTPFTLVKWQEHLATQDNFYIPLSPVFDSTIQHATLENLLSDKTAGTAAQKFEAAFENDVERLQTFKAIIDTSKLAGTPDASLVLPANTVIDAAHPEIQSVALMMHLPTFDVRDEDGKKVLIAYSGLEAEVSGQNWRHIKTTYFTGKGYTLPTELKATIKTEAKKAEILAALDEVVKAIKAIIK